MADLLHVTAGNFDGGGVTTAEEPVLLDFWAEWCGPCRMVTPVVEALAKKYAGKLKVGKVNVDEEGELARASGFAASPRFCSSRAARSPRR